MTKKHIKGKIYALTLQTPANIPRESPVFKEEPTAFARSPLHLTMSRLACPTTPIRKGLRNPYVFPKKSKNSIKLREKIKLKNS